MTNKFSDALYSTYPTYAPMKAHVQPEVLLLVKSGSEWTTFKGIAKKGVQYHAGYGYSHPTFNGDTMMNPAHFTGVAYNIAIEGLMPHPHASGEVGKIFNVAVYGGDTVVDILVAKIISHLPQIFSVDDDYRKMIHKAVDLALKE